MDETVVVAHRVCKKPWEGRCFLWGRMKFQLKPPLIIYLCNISKTLDDVFFIFPRPVAKHHAYRCLQ